MNEAMRETERVISLCLMEGTIEDYLAFYNGHVIIKIEKRQSPQSG